MLTEASRLSAFGPPLARVVEIDFVSVPDTGLRAIVAQPSKFNSSFALDRVFELEYASFQSLPPPVDGFILTEDGYFLLTESLAALVRE
jgi:hypothetical protein